MKTTYYPSKNQPTCDLVKLDTTLSGMFDECVKITVFNDEQMFKNANHHTLLNKLEPKHIERFVKYIKPCGFNDQQMFKNVNYHRLLNKLEPL